MTINVASAAADIVLGGESKRTIHGFLTQAYARSSKGVYLGTPEEGTTDDRNVALQFRYDYSSKDAFVIPFSDRRLGSQSPVQPFIDGVQRNWVFYERHFFGGTRGKVGKFPLPLGITMGRSLKVDQRMSGEVHFGFIPY